MRVERNTLRRAIGLHPATLQRPLRGSHQPLGFGYLDARDLLAFFHEDGGADTHWGRGFVRDHGGQRRRVLVNSVQARNPAIIFDADENLASLAIAHTDYRSRQLIIW